VAEHEFLRAVGRLGPTSGRLFTIGSADPDLEDAQLDLVGRGDGRLGPFDQTNVGCAGFEGEREHVRPVGSGLERPRRWLVSDARERLANEAAARTVRP